MSQCKQVRDLTEQNKFQVHPRTSIGVHVRRSVGLLVGRLRKLKDVQNGRF